MVDLKPAVREALEGIEGCKAFFYYPESFKVLPCVSYYEADNSPAVFGEDAEYASEIVYVIDVWGASSESVTAIAGEVNRRMAALGFVREFSRDLRGEDPRIRQKNLRFKLLKGC